MPITVTELTKARRITGKGSSRKYKVIGATTEVEAYNAVVTDAGVPLVIGGTYNRLDSDIDLDEVEPNLYFAVVPWATADFGPVMPNNFRITFDIAGQVQHITQSRKTLGKYYNGGGVIRTPLGVSETVTAISGGYRGKDFKGAINVQQGGEVDGIDILIPSLAYTVEYVFDAEDVNQDYVLTLRSLVGTVNKATFHQFPAGECLLTRASGQKREDGAWDMAFAFASLENAVDLVIGEGSDAITVKDKKGWDLLWVYYEDKDINDGDGQTFCHKRPLYAFVEQVYLRGDFDLLEI